MTVLIHLTTDSKFSQIYQNLKLKIRLQNYLNLLKLRILTKKNRNAVIHRIKSSLNNVKIMLTNRIKCVKINKLMVLIGSIVDVTDTTEVVKAVMTGNNCIKKVNVLNFKNKCSDLSKCKTQQDTVFGVLLPLSNFRRLHMNNALKTNCVLNTNTFDPIKTHYIVEATGKYNFKEAKIQLPSEINLDYLETLTQN